MTKETEQSQAQVQAPNVQITRENKGLSVNVDKIDEVAAWMSQARAPEAYNPNIPFTLAHEKMKIVNVESVMPHPARIRKNITFTTTTSFLSYFDEFKPGSNPKLFVTSTNKGMKIRAIMDYDRPGEDLEGGVTYPLPQWNSHKTTLELNYYADYQLLKDHENTWMSQTDFALFIEENTHLFKDPDSASMLELAQHLKGSVNVKWQSGKRLANGETSLEYIEEVKATSHKGDLTVPEYILMTTPIYDGFSASDVRAAFRWRIGDEKKALFSFKLLTKLQERAAEDAVKKQVVAHTELPLLDVLSFEGTSARQ